MWRAQQCKVLLQDKDLGLRVPSDRVSHALTPEASSKRAHNDLQSENGTSASRERENCSQQDVHTSWNMESQSVGISRAD